MGVLSASTVGTLASRICAESDVPCVTKHVVGLLAQQHVVDAFHPRLARGHHQGRGELIAAYIGRAALFGIEAMHTGLRLLEQAMRRMADIIDLRGGRGGVAKRLNFPAIQGANLARCLEIGNAADCQAPVALETLDRVPRMGAESPIRSKGPAMFVGVAQGAELDLQLSDRMLARTLPSHIRGGERPKHGPWKCVGRQGRQRLAFAQLGQELGREPPFPQCEARLAIGQAVVTVVDHVRGLPDVPGRDVMHVLVPIPDCNVDGVIGIGGELWVVDQIESQCHSGFTVAVLAGQLDVSATPVLECVTWLGVAHSSAVHEVGEMLWTSLQRFESCGFECFAGEHLDEIADELDVGLGRLAVERIESRRQSVLEGEVVAAAGAHEDLRAPVLVEEEDGRRGLELLHLAEQEIDQRRLAGAGLADHHRVGNGLLAQRVLAGVGGVEVEVVRLGVTTRSQMTATRGPLGSVSYLPSTLEPLGRSSRLPLKE
jgi:hypothetical protein